MKAKAEYKSAVRSRKLIRTAFIELLHEKNVEKITVTDIVNRADISRGTFYAHYADVLGLTEEIEKEISEQIVTFLEEMTNNDFVQDPLPYFLQIARFLEKDIDFYRLVIGTNGASTFMTKLKGIFINKILTSTENVRLDQENEDFIVYVNFFANGLVQIFHDWIAGEMPGSIEDLAKSVSRIMTHGFQAYIIKQ